MKKSRKWSRTKGGSDLVVRSVSSNGSIQALTEEVVQLLAKVGDQRNALEVANSCNAGSGLPNVRLYGRWGDDLVGLARSVLMYAIEVAVEAREVNAEVLAMVAARAAEVQP